MTVGDCIRPQRSKRPARRLEEVFDRQLYLVAQVARSHPQRSQRCGVLAVQTANGVVIVHGTNQFVRPFLNCQARFLASRVSHGKDLDIVVSRQFL